VECFELLAIRVRLCVDGYVVECFELFAEASVVKDRKRT
jgi:hypothetical protein